MEISKDNFTQKDAKILPGNVLAWIGDSVFDLMVRDYIIKNDRAKMNANQKKAVSYVNAKAQSEAYQLIKKYLSEDEAYILKRGKNSQSAKIPKKASAKEYRRATGLEALFGYLYLLGKTQRLEEIFELIMNGDKNAGK